MLVKHRGTLELNDTIQDYFYFLGKTKKIIQIWTYFFSIRVTKRWYGMPRKVVESPPWTYTKVVWTRFWAASSRWT